MSSSSSEAMVVENSNLSSPSSSSSLYESSLQALLYSTDHQATTKEEIAKSAARRVHTVSDMRHYWNIILQQNQNQQKSPIQFPKRIIHITGTKGKGSTACMCESILRSHGYSTGLFTSPHLMDIRERIRWNGKPIHSNIFGTIYWKIRNSLEQHAAASKNDNNSNDNNNEIPILPGYFRYLTLMAYLTFCELQVDVMIIEVGMGGRYDATNFVNFADSSNVGCEAVACGVTLLDLDHTRILGNTVEKIAWEKGGIFAIHDKACTIHISPRPQQQEEKEETTETEKEEETPTTATTTTTTIDAHFFILDSNTPGVLNVFQQCANIEGKGTPLTLIDAKGMQLRKNLGIYLLGLAGQHQYGNATLAVSLCHAVTKNLIQTTTTTSGIISLDNPVTLQGLQTASWPARCQTVQQGRYVYRLDGAHTFQSLEATMEWFRQQQAPKIGSNALPILVFNTSHERDPVELLNLLKPFEFQKVYFAKSDSSRPSPVNVPTARELLEQAGISFDENRPEFQSTTTTNQTWQETLGLVWQHLKKQQTQTQTEQSQTEPIECNMTAVQVLADIAANTKTNSNDGNEEDIEIIVTGSLYLVGSFLTALNWNEESSPDHVIQ